MFLDSEPSVFESYEITPQDYQALREKGQPHLLLDVREGWEIELAALYPHRHIPLEDLSDNLNKLDKKLKIIVLCHKGSRSLRACCFLKLMGFENVFSLSGGIDAWSQMIENTVPHIGREFNQ